MLKRCRIAIEHVGAVKYPCIQARRSIVAFLTDHVVTVRPHRQLWIIVRDSKKESVCKPAGGDRIRTLGHCDALIFERITRLKWIVGKVSYDPPVCKVIIKDVRIAALALARIARGSSRPKRCGICRTGERSPRLIEDLKREVHDRNVMIRSYGAVIVRRAVPRLASIEVGTGICELRRGYTGRHLLRATST